jgi:pyruvate ferredoxin oxidoreductase gamma subunit
VNVVRVDIDGLENGATPRKAPTLFQVRFHGRGGQGVVTAAEMLSVAAFVEGRHAQAFPSFGSERAGAPVVAFCRISDTEIRTHSPIAAPDAVVVQDATLLHQVNLFAGLGSDGYLLINTTHSLEELGLGELAAGMRRDRLAIVPATQLALQHLGRPVPNAVLLGGLAALSGVVSLDAVVGAIKERFTGPLADGNAAAAAAAYRIVAEQQEEVASRATPA